MKQVKIIIERSEKMFWAYAENVPFITGSDYTVEETKNSILEVIKIFKKENKVENIPAILKGEYSIVYKFDAESFFDFYKGVSWGHLEMVFF